MKQTVEAIYLGCLLLLPCAGARAEVRDASPARITVHLPAEASLFIDDVLCTLTSETRAIDTPALEPGHDYQYTLRVEAARNGRAVSKSKLIFFRAGDMVRVDFGDLSRDPAVQTTKAAEKAKPAKANSNHDNKGDLALTEQEKALLQLTNTERAREGLPPLQANQKLFQAARGHSENMAKHERLDHTLNGKGPGERLSDVGYQHLGWGENIAAGQQTPEEAITTWMSSPGHRGNILNASYQEIGLGIARSAAGQMYDTQVFGIPRDR